MQNEVALFGMGAKILEGADADTIDLGPLNNFSGTWEGQSSMVGM